MKKIFLKITYLFIFLIGITSCTKHDDLKNTFFSESYLSSYNLESLPEPNLDESLLRDGNYLYLNLTTNEYINYVSEIKNYLIGREDVYHVSYLSYTNLWLDYICRPFRDDYKVKNESISIFFTKNEELESDNKMIDPIKINIIKKENKIGFKEYNCYITIDSNLLPDAIIDYSCYDHVYDYSVYEEIICPSTNNPSIVKKYTCIYCDNTTRSHSISDYKEHSVKITHGKEYMINNLRSDAFSGLEYEIITNKYVEAEIVVTINGINIPKRVGEDEDTWSFVFIMPPEDVDIKIELISGTNIE